MSAGKGDKPRPVDKKIFDKNYDNIDWEVKPPDDTSIKIKNVKTHIVYKQ